MIVNSGSDNTAAARMGFNRGSESAPSVGSLFSAMPPSLSPAQASSRDVVAAVPQITPAVPEPAEWTMLIAGLLVVGAIARRRHHNR
jgi:hypothetical protein